MKLEELKGRRFTVVTQNTEYRFDWTGPTLSGVGNRRHDLGPARYMDIPTDDVEIKGTKLSRYFWDALPEDAKRVGEVVKGGYLYFRYPGHSDYITTSRIEDVILD